MATELKPCERCGSNETYRMGNFVGCDKCNYTRPTPEDWNTRTMPECVRRLLQTFESASQQLAMLGSDMSEEIDDRRNAVKKYYGEGGG